MGADPDTNGATGSERGREKGREKGSEKGTEGMLLTVELPAVTSEARQVATAAGCMRVPGFALPARTVQLDAALAAELVARARAAAASAHAPYSRFHVGAALVMADDPAQRIRTGANIENASHGAGICAERTAIVQAAAAGFRQLKLLAVSCVDAAGEASGAAPLAARSPCGICRQVIREFVSTVDAGDALVLVDSAEPDVLCDVLDIDRLLPWGFALQPDG